MTVALQNRWACSLPALFRRQDKWYAYLSITRDVEWGFSAMISKYRIEACFVLVSERIKYSSSVKARFFGGNNHRNDQTKDLPIK